jgi:predicted nuclease of predicted toxin-antitoxin system
MPQLVANENFPLPAVKLLRERGVDVTAVAEVMSGSADEKVLDFARREGRWLVTFDRDYGELVFSRGLAAPPAILYFRQGPYAPTRPAELVLELIAQPEQVVGFFVVVSERSIRRRPLPQPQS